MMGAPNSLNLNCKVRVMEDAPSPSFSVDIFRNYIIDWCYICLTLVVIKDMPVKLMESAQIKRFLFKFIASRDKSANWHLKKRIYLLPCSLPHLSYGLKRDSHEIYTHGAKGLTSATVAQSYLQEWTTQNILQNKDGNQVRDLTLLNLAMWRYRNKCGGNFLD